MGRFSYVLAALISLLLVAPASAAPATRLYVALGDSFTAGPLIPNPKGDPIDCGRSDHNYPTLVAQAIAVPEFRDVSCSSAQTEHMTEPQDELPLGGTNPPQFKALGRRVDLVTAGIGGNDMGFGDLAITCGELGFQSLGMGRPCTEHYTVDGVNRVTRRIDKVVAPRLARVINGIHARSPRARVLVVGDPDFIPQPPGCYPIVPIAAGDLPFLHEIARRLAAMKRRVARAGGAEYVDLLTGSIGHDVCQLPGTKWYEGAVPTSAAFPAHPNALGMEFAARQVLAVLRRPVPNDFAILRRTGRPGGEVILRLRAPYRGRFTISARPARGAGVRYATRSFFAARASKLTARLSPIRTARADLRRLRRVRVSLTITFRPVAGEPFTRRSAVRVGVS